MRSRASAIALSGDFSSFAGVRATLSSQQHLGDLAGRAPTTREGQSLGGFCPICKRNQGLLSPAFVHRATLTPALIH